MTYRRHFSTACATMTFAVLTASCTTTVDVKNVSLAEVGRSPGMYYALPQTELGIAVEATMKDVKSGQYSKTVSKLDSQKMQASLKSALSKSAPSVDASAISAAAAANLPANLATLDATALQMRVETALSNAATTAGATVDASKVSKAAIADAKRRDTAFQLQQCIATCSCTYEVTDAPAKYTIKTVTATPRAVPDFSQLFRVNVDAGGVFKSAAYKMTLNEALAMTKGSATITDQTSDFAFDVAAKVASIAVKAMVGGGVPLAPGAGTPACAPTTLPTNPTAQQLTDNARMGDLHRVHTRLGAPILDANGDLDFDGGTLDDDVANLRTAKKLLACNGSDPGAAQCKGPTASDAALTAAFAQLDLSITRLESEREELLGWFRKEVTSSETQMTFQGFIPAAAITAAASGASLPITWVGNTNSQNAANGMNLVAQLSWAPAPPAANEISGKTKPSSGRDEPGYRYRIPLYADFAVMRDSAMIHTSKVSIAQLGQVAALPAKFQGKASTSSVELFELTGGPKNLETSNTAIDPAKPMGVVNNVISAREAAITQADADATAAATAAKPVNILKSEKDELAALDEVCKLRVKTGRPLGTECANWKPQ